MGAKKTLFIATVLVFALVCSGCSFHPITSEETESTVMEIRRLSTKSVLSDRLIIDGVLPSLENHLKDCDLALYGEIVQLEPAVLTPAYAGSDGLIGKNCVKYTIKIIETIAGSTDSTTIECRLLGDFGVTMTKPEKPGKVVMILSYHPNGFYVSAQLEHTIYTVDDQGKLYALSNLEHLSVYDGKDVSVLIEAMKAIAGRVREK